MRDTEFWGVMAETVNQAKAMPDYVGGDGSGFSYVRGPCNGICAIISSAWRADLIDMDQAGRLYRQLRQVKPKNAGYMYYWSPQSWRPRAKAMRELSQRSQRSRR